LKGLLCLLVAASPLQAAALPAWWQALPGLVRLESDFVQESESAVFGKLEKDGKIQLAQGGRLRVTYRQGMVLVSDGVNLIQYDPAAVTAQRTALRTATQEMPLLNILVNPAALSEAYRISSERADQVNLEPKRKDLPRIVVEGRDGFLRRVFWKDATGAQQMLELKNPHVPGTSFPPAVFTFKTPGGTRWIK
jgi:outer membrane lipoprotein-sorting protein